LSRPRQESCTSLTMTDAWHRSPLTAPGSRGRWHGALRYWPSSSYSRCGSGGSFSGECERLSPRGARTPCARTPPSPRPASGHPADPASRQSGESRPADSPRSCAPAPASHSTRHQQPVQPEGGSSNQVAEHEHRTQREPYCRSAGTGCCGPWDGCLGLRRSAPLILCGLAGAAVCGCHRPDATTT